MKIEQLSQPKKILGKRSMLAKKRVLLAGVAVSAMFILFGCASQSTQSSGMESSASSGVAIAGEAQSSGVDTSATSGEGVAGECILRD